MATEGRAIVDFGAIPGSDLATLVIAGQAGIVANSFVEAYLDATAAATADHSPDEHIAEAPYIAVTCSSIVAGVGFTINLKAGGPNLQYGKWNVIWVWV